MPVVEDSKLRNYQRALYACCGIIIVAMAIVLAITLVAYNFVDNYNYKYIDLSSARAYVISIGVITILAQFFGVYASSRVSYWMSLTYGMILSMLAGITVVYAIIYGNLYGYFLTVLFFIVSCVASLYAKHIKKLKKAALNTTVYITGMPGQQQVVYQVPANAGQVNYAMPGQPMTAPNGNQMYVTNPYNPYQQQGFQMNPQMTTSPAGGVSHSEPILQPPTYGQSQESATSAGPQHPVPATIAEHKSMPAAPGWQP